MPIIDDGTHAVDTASVAMIVKAFDSPYTVWMLCVVLKATVSSFPLQFTTEGERDDFYKKVVESMTS